MNKKRLKQLITNKNNLLEIENSKLKIENNNLTTDINKKISLCSELQDTNSKLLLLIKDANILIEKMKCCENCTHQRLDGCHLGISCTNNDCWSLGVNNG